MAGYLTTLGVAAAVLTLGGLVLTAAAARVGVAYLVAVVTVLQKRRSMR